MTDTSDIQFYANQLLAATQVAAPQWVEQQIIQHIGNGLSQKARQQIQQLAADASDQVVAALEKLLFTDIDQQQTTPLSILRQLVPTVTQALESYDIERPYRDSQKNKIYPHDVYDITPANFAAFGADMHEAGIAWGAAKAYEHLRRRKQQKNRTA